MTGLQLAILAGILCGLGLAVLVAQLVPAQPELSSALSRLAPERTSTVTAVGTGRGLQDRAGLWVHRHLPSATAARLPRRELALLRIPLHQYLGEKVGFAAVGLLFPAGTGVLVGLVGWSLPFAVPAVVGLVLAVVLSFVPDVNVRGQAADARQEFTRALSAYIDLVALERRNSSGSTQALTKAAEIGDSWVFQRLREELARANWSGTPPWDGLAELADELGLPDLADLGDIMRLSDQGSRVYTTLRARAAGLRSQLLNDEHGQANAASQRMTAPLACLAIVFVLLLMAPVVLRAFL